MGRPYFFTLAKLSSGYTPRLYRMLQPHQTPRINPHCRNFALTLSISNKPASGIETTSRTCWPRNLRPNHAIRHWRGGREGGIGWRRVRTEELADDGGGALERNDVLGRRPRRHLSSASVVHAAARLLRALSLRLWVRRARSWLSWEERGATGSEAAAGLWNGTGKGENWEVGSRFRNGSIDLVDAHGAAF